MHQQGAPGAPSEVTHYYKDGTTGPQAKKVPAKIKARLEQILTEAQRKQAAQA